MTYIRSIASALPPTRYGTPEVASWCGSDEALITEKVGIVERCFLGPEESIIELAARACERLFADNTHISTSHIGLCLYVAQVHDQTIPHSSALLQHRLDLPKGCACMDVGLACSGYVYALATARGIMETEGIDHALIVTCDPYSRIMGRENRDTVPLFGDAATATWLSRSGPGAHLGRADLGTDGSGAAWLHCDRPAAGNMATHLTMNGRGIFQFAVKRVPESIERCLQRNGMNKCDIKLFLLHQANLFIIKNLCSILQISEAQCPATMQHTGNTVSSSLPLVLEHYLPHLRHDDNVILCGFGGGLSWGTTTITMQGGTS